MATRNEVDDWMDAYDNPQKEVVEAIRRVILGADERISECIKWKSPTFTYRGNLCSFNPRSKKHASLMFHTGAEIPGEHAILAGDTRKARTVKIADLEDLAQQQEALEAVVRAWCDDKDS